jgi:hypothetical protein
MPEPPDSDEATTREGTNTPEGAIVRAPEPGRSSAIERLGDRIADPQTPIRDAAALTRLRSELVKQDQDQLDRVYARRADSRQFWARLGFSLIAQGIGVSLIWMQFRLEGFVVLGIGLYWLAPRFVADVYGNLLGGKGRRDE